MSGPGPTQTEDVWSTHKGGKPGHVFDLTLYVVNRLLSAKMLHLFEVSINICGYDALLLSEDFPGRHHVCGVCRGQR